MAKATSQSYALWPESSVTVQQLVPVKWGLVLYTGWMPSPPSPPREAHAARVDGTTPRWYRYMLEVLTPLRAQQAETGGSRDQKIGLDEPILQRTATPRNGGRRIVALKGAGSNPVGHLPEICPRAGHTSV
jgi:hypothetical protein